MAMKIDADACVDCGACVEPCPNHAIVKGGDPYTLKGVSHPALSEKYYVVPELCTQCVGYFDEPQCVPACPVDCITVDEALGETPEALNEKFRALKEGA